MRRAILILTLVVIGSFGFVLLHLRFRAEAGVPTGGPSGAPLLGTREDGTVYAVSLQISRLERRLMEEEKRSAALQEAIEALKRERDALREEVDALQGQVRTLRRQLAPKPETPPSQLPPASPPPTPAPAPSPTPTPQPPAGM